MAGFVYTAENLVQIERSVSSERLAPYVADVGGDLHAAVRLYEQNTLLSEGLYGILQALEVALRNGVHTQLLAGFGTPSWWTVVPLGVDQQNVLRKAQAALTREGKPFEPGRVIAELSFGFWTGLFGPAYTDLWRDHLVKAFPRRPLQRSEVQHRLNSIRKLRNRVAHHESILHRPLQRDVNQIFDTLSWMNPVVARWVRTNNSFEQRYQHYSKLFPRKLVGTIAKEFLRCHS